MRIWRFRGLLVAVVLGSASLGGCGGQEEGTLVEVDKEKEKALTDSMESYYTKEKAP